MHFKNAIRGLLTVSTVTLTASAAAVAGDFGTITVGSTIFTGSGSAGSVDSNFSPVTYGQYNTTTHSFTSVEDILNAYVTDPNKLAPGGSWHAPFAGSEWITPYLSPSVPAYSHNPNATVGRGTHSDERTGAYEYTTQFTLQPNQSFTLTGSLYADNVPIDILLDGVSVVSSLSTVHSGTEDYYQFSHTFSAAESHGNPQTLSFVVNNATGGPTGLDMVARISAVPEPGTYAAFLVGGLGVLGLMARARRRCVGLTAV